MDENIDDPVEESQPFVELIGVTDENLVEKVDSDENLVEKVDSAASIINPNSKDDRKLFHRRRTDFSWDPNLPYEQQPNMLEKYGPVPLEFPDHFYEVEGGIVIIYWEAERSVGCIGSIVYVDEEKSTFSFRVYGWQGKTRQT